MVQHGSLEKLDRNVIVRQSAIDNFGGLQRWRYPQNAEPVLRDEVQASVEAHVTPLPLVLVRG